MNDDSAKASTQHQYIAIEGAIGVGKTSLAKRLATRYGCDILLEQAPDNPFLERFYKNPEQYALATQLYFLFQRSQQLDHLHERDFFAKPVISDFLMAKDPLFAEVNLDLDELALYRKVYDKLTFNMPQPDLVIYLQAPETVLSERIHQRGIDVERHISGSYLQRLNEAYRQLFHYYDASPLLIVNAEQIDFVNNDEHLNQLIDYIANIRRGRHYLNPSIFS